MSESNSPSNSAPSRVSLKRYADGKYYLFADAASDHHQIVKQALAKAGQVCIQFDDEIFRTTLRAAGIADATIETYLDSVTMIDDVFGYDRNPG